MHHVTYLSFRPPLLMWCELTLRTGSKICSVWLSSLTDILQRSKINKVIHALLTIPKAIANHFSLKFSIWLDFDMILTWFWHDFNLVFTWFWLDFDLILTWFWHNLTWCWHDFDLTLRKSTKYEKIMKEKGFNQIIKKPTFETGSIIDHI